MASPPSLTPIAEDVTVSHSEPAMSVDEEALFDVNHDIKSTLTELLNCEAVRNDKRMRLWVQTRLMDAELELKRQRKRRVSTPTIVLSPAEDEERRDSC